MTGNDKLCNQNFNNKDTIFNMVKYTWLSPDFKKQKNLAQRYIQLCTEHSIDQQKIHLSTKIKNI